MALAESYVGSITVSTTELSLVSGTSTLQSVTDDVICQVFLDAGAVTDADLFVLQGKEKVQSAGTQRVFTRVPFTKNANSPLIASPSFILMHGWDWTLTKLVGTDRAIPYSVRTASSAGITEPYTGSGATISTTEWSLVNGGTTLQSITDDGIYQLWLDANALADGDSFEGKIKEKPRAADSQLVTHYWTLIDAMGLEKLYVSPCLELLHGWDMTMKKLAGTDRAIPYSIRKIA
jgi:hypothetical protein